MSNFIYKGIPIHYEKKENGDKHFIFLHGLGGDSSQPLSTFESNSYTIIAPDMPHHGKTKEGELSFHNFAQIVHALMLEQNLTKAVIGGISMGAAIATHFAIQYPQMVNKLVLIRPAWLNAPMSDEKIKMFQKIASYMRKENGTSLFISDPEFMKMKEEYPAIYSSFLSFFVYKKDPLPLEEIPPQISFSNMEDLEKITSPTLVVSTMRDFMHPIDFAKKIAQVIPNSVFYEAQSKSVDAKLHREQVKKYIEEFLS